MFFVGEFNFILDNLAFFLFNASTGRKKDNIWISNKILSYS
jgi:hypothetical protein